jgi:hypothetical protein
MVDDAQATVADFIIECHGQKGMQCDFSHSTVVSTQWIASCFEVYVLCCHGCFFTVYSRSRLSIIPCTCTCKFL